MGRCSAHLKHHVFQTCYGLGLCRVLKAVNRLRRKRVTVVTYHRVTERNIDQLNRSLPNLFVQAETFENHIRFFRRHYTIITFEDLCGLREDDRLPSDPLLITFDDGYADFYRCAYPILKKYEVRATLFIAAGRIGTGRAFPFWWDELYARLDHMRTRDIRGDSVPASAEIARLYEVFREDAKACLDGVLETCTDREIDRYLQTLRHVLGDDVADDAGENAVMDWDQVKKVSDIVGIGSHTLSHGNLRYMTVEEIEDEVIRSKREIEGRTGRQVLAFSYPYGYYDPRVIRAVASAGFMFAVTTERGLDDLSDALRMKRINLWERSSSTIPGRFSEGKLALIAQGL